MNPLVSVITPTYMRHDLLLGRCIPSVQQQGYRPLEHVIVSDGPDPYLQSLIGEHLGGLPVPLRYGSTAVHRGCWGGLPRRHATELATGEYLAYLDDDDTYRDDHVLQLAAVLDRNPHLGAAYSWMLCHMADGRELRYPGPPGVMIGTPMIMHRRELLDIAGWQDGPGEDWALIGAWLNAGVKFGEVPQVTVDVYPSPASEEAISKNEPAWMMGPW